MSRPEKRTVDYFPHYPSGDTMRFIRKKYGNDGYATWFTILERLASARDHWIKLDRKKRKLLASDCLISEEKLFEILDELAEWGEIDKELWQKERVIFSTKFRESILDAYRRRGHDPPGLCDLYDVMMGDENRVNVVENRVNVVENSYIDTKTHKEKKRKEKKNTQSVRACEEILNYWNSKEHTTSHAAVTTQMVSSLEKVLEHYEIEEVKKAIDKLDWEVERNPNSFWNGAKFSSFLFSSNSGIENFEQVLNQEESGDRGKDCSLLNGGSACRCTGDLDPVYEEGELRLIVENGRHVFMGV